MYYTVKIKSDNEERPAIETALTVARSMNPTSILVFEKVNEPTKTGITITENETHVCYDGTFEEGAVQFFRSRVFDVVVSHRFDKLNLEKIGIDIQLLIANEGTSIQYDDVEGPTQTLNGIPLDERRGPEPVYYRFESFNDSNNEVTLVENILGTQPGRLIIKLDETAATVKELITMIEVVARRSVPGFCMSRGCDRDLIKALPLHRLFVKRSVDTTRLKLKFVEYVDPYTARGVVVVNDDYELPFSMVYNVFPTVQLRDGTVVHLVRNENIRADIKQINNVLHSALVEATRA